MLVIVSRVIFTPHFLFQDSDPDVLNVNVFLDEEATNNTREGEDPIPTSYNTTSTTNSNSNTTADNAKGKVCLDYLTNLIYGKYIWITIENIYGSLL
jgi:hypothetical protein